ncbi:amidase [Tenacibaculum sp. S7007]|uniref:Amidase n=1 Tax=Tenacibaculum pelagium TaxID=2759527 RepID=A0A839AQA9_9FLAO|nr:amidase family protein [Tenacibaculum pelagium]MBA6156538.1 amidase [Tenacibaculum pelagium]
MKKIYLLLVIIIVLISCKEEKKENVRMQFKLINSKFQNIDDVFKPFESSLSNFSEEEYNTLKAIVLEQDIPSLQKMIKEGDLTYEKLTLFYLFRMRKIETNSEFSLNSIIALNLNVLEEAKEKDLNKENVSEFSVYGMPILLKDNINTNNMPTTAGAIALANNRKTEDAFIVQKLKENGALILGKVNLSEWAYFFCLDCPLGYSAVGGQTLNPYGRKVFETGGSSAGSGVAVAANFAVAALGTETAGSITSPSSKNSVVGLKPTIGVLSRTGIVPISSTLDTPGPMTKNVIDNAILYNAMLGVDSTDVVSIKTELLSLDFGNKLVNASLKGKKFGVLKSLMENKIYKESVEKIKTAGAEVVEVDPSRISFDGFLTLLNIDMKHDLPKYLKNYSDKNVKIASVEDVITFNLKDSILRAPYGQQLLYGIIKDETTLEEFEVVKNKLNAEGKKYLQAIENQKLDAILSIDNFDSGIAAVAKYPTITVPMGYESGEPKSLTFIGKPYSESNLLKLAYAFEQLTKVRKMPKNYN